MLGQEVEHNFCGPCHRLVSWRNETGSGCACGYEYVTVELHAYSSVWRSSELPVNDDGTMAWLDPYEEPVDEIAENEGVDVDDVQSELSYQPGSAECPNCGRARPGLTIDYT